MKKLVTLTPGEGVVSVPAAAKEIGKSRLVVLGLVAAGKLKGRPGSGRTFLITRRSLNAYRRRIERDSVVAAQIGMRDDGSRGSRKQ